MGRERVGREKREGGKEEEGEKLVEREGEGEGEGRREWARVSVLPGDWRETPRQL